MAKFGHIQKERSGFVFQGIKHLVSEIYKVNLMKASSYIELPENYKRISQL